MKKITCFLCFQSTSSISTGQYFRH